MLKKSNRIRRKSIRRRRSRSKSKCRKYLSKKIAINIDEFKRGLFKSKKQAIAVSYSQVRKKHPACKRIFKKL